MFRNLIVLNYKVWSFHFYTAVPSSRCYSASRSLLFFRQGSVLIGWNDLLSKWACKSFLLSVFSCWLKQPYLFCCGGNATEALFILLPQLWNARVLRATFDCKCVATSLHAFRACDGECNVGWVVSISRILYGLPLTYNLTTGWNRTNANAKSRMESNHLGQ